VKLSRWGQLDSSLSVRFVLPVIWENTLTIVVGLLFSRVISGISASALAAIGMSNTVMTVAFAVFSMVTTGASVLVSRHIGAQESREAANTVEQTILLSLVSSSVVTLLCFAAASPILRLLMPTAEDQLFSEAVRYFRILVLSLPLYVLHSALSTICRSMGDSKNPLIVALFMNVVQLIAGYVLIAQAGLEEIGAGLAYIVCRIVGSGLMLWTLTHNQKYFVLQLKNVLRPRMATITRILRIGIPVSIESIFVQVGYMLGNSMSIALGTFEAGVYQVMNTLNTFMTIGQPICATIALSAVGHMLGAKRITDAKKGGMFIWYMGIAATVLLGSIVLIWAVPLCGLYSSDPATVSSASGIMWILLVMDIAGISINAIDPQLRAGGDVKYVMIITLTAVWLIRLPLTWLFSFHFDMGVMGIFLANTISLYYRAILGLVRHRGNQWIKKKI